MDRAVLPLLATLCKKDLYLRDTPSQDSRKEADGKCMQPIQMVGKCILQPVSNVAGIHSLTHQAQTLQMLLLRPDIRRALCNLQPNIDEPSVLHQRLVLGRRGNRVSDFLAPLEEQVRPLQCAAVFGDRVVIAFEAGIHFVHFHVSTGFEGPDLSAIMA